jgi:uncharacterized protein YceH (UPF0502 family)
MAEFDGLDEIDHELRFLSAVAEPLATNLGRRPGQKEERWASPLFAPPVAMRAVPPTRESTRPAERVESARHGSPDGVRSDADDTLGELRSEIAALRSEVVDLRLELNDLRTSLGG